MVQSDPRAKCMLYNQRNQLISVIYLVHISDISRSFRYQRNMSLEVLCVSRMLRRSWQIFYHHFQSLGGAINVTLCFPLLCYCFPLPWCLSQHCALCSNMPAALIIVALWHNHVLSDKWKNEWMNSFIRVTRITEMSSLIRPRSH